MTARRRFECALRTLGVLLPVVIAAPIVARASMPEPPATRIADVVDTLHGVAVHDPYRWLEDFESAEAQAWLTAQEDYAKAVLAEEPDREAVRARLKELFEIPSLGSVAQREDRLFFTRRDPDDEQEVLYVQRGLDGKPEELIDPTKLGTDPPISLDWWYPSEDGALLAYGTSEGGNEMSTLRVMNVDTHELLDDAIPRTRLASLAWEPDGNGFYYTRFPAPGEVPADEEFFHRKVYHHALGEDYTSDPLVFGGNVELHTWTGIALSTNGRFLIGLAFHGSTRNDLFVRDLTETKGPWRPIAQGIDSLFTGIPIENTLYMMTYHEAPKGRILKVDLEHPEQEHWVEIIPEGGNAMQSYLYAGGRLFVHYLENAHSRIKVFTADGEYMRDILLPDFASLFDWAGDWRESYAFIGIDSYLMPPTVFRYDIETGALERHMGVEAPIDMAPYVTEQVWYPSRDGTAIPMFLVHRRDIALDGTNPTILTGYGGFNSSMTPGFARNRYLWLDHGGIFAEANLRGGGEFGESWHRDGMLGKKQNTFDDFIAAAEWLVGKGYTRPSRLAVWGGSNGGLLVGAFIAQRPDLAAAAICDVPLLDMTRYHLLYGGRTWTPEYGSPDDAEQFAWLYAYSPYHRVVDGTAYPAVYLTTGESDTRVHPGHAMKMAARLQKATSSGRPVLLRFERQAGHGGGSLMSQTLELYTDYFSFLFLELGMRY
jgi:prolyl oligopeptidase